MKFLKRLLGARSNETDALLERLHRFFTSDEEQNALLPSEIRSQLYRGADVDEVAGAVGAFGRAITNPVPVNGPVGEVLYISSLRSGDRFLFAHRLGSRGRLDLYETVTSDGNEWGLLYFDPYHPRKSRHAPEGMQFRTGMTPPLISATNTYQENFPFGMRDAIRSWTSSTLGGPLISAEIRTALESHAFERSERHRSRLSTHSMHGRLEEFDERVPLTRAFIDKMAVNLKAVFISLLGIREYENDEVMFFCAAILTYTYLHFRDSQPDEQFLDAVSLSIVSDTLKKSSPRADTVKRYQVLFLEYSSLLDAVFDKAADQKHELITLLLHVVERTTGNSAKPLMLKIVANAQLLAVLLDDSYKFVREHLKEGYPDRAR